MMDILVFCGGMAIFQKVKYLIIRNHRFAPMDIPCKKSGIAIENPGKNLSLTLLLTALLLPHEPRQTLPSS